MEVSNKAKERFCKDCNIPIKIYREPYFEDRLELYDRFYGTLDKWRIFTRELQKYKSEQDYFEEYNRIKDAAINSIKNTEAYQRFNAEDMGKFSLNHKNLPENDIYKPTNDGRMFISVDMKKANFSSLQFYDENIFGGANTWEEFIGKFTQNEHIMNSKYIRQVILGNCNPKRHITFEKYIMNLVISGLRNVMDEHYCRIVSFSNDEIVYEMTMVEKLYVFESFKSLISAFLNLCPISFNLELFSLHKIEGTDGYCKKIYKDNGEYDIKLKCLNDHMAPFVMRYLLGEKIIDSDRVFYYKGTLAKFTEDPEIHIDLERVLGSGD